MTMIKSPNSDEYIMGLFQLCIIPIWFIPGVLYRIILKSTLWLWWILWFIGGAPGIDRGVPGIKADHVRKLWAKISIGIAFLALLSFAVPNIVIPWFGFEAPHPPIPPLVALFIVVDWSNIAILPFIGAVTAILTIAFIVWVDSIEKDEELGRDVSTSLLWFAHVANLKKGLGLATILLTMLYIALFVNALNGWLPVSDFAYDKLEWIYGKYAVSLVPEPQGS